jgi:menaquinone-specific isochorismate synthase
LVAFVSFGFFEEATSVLVVPEVLVLREGGRTWLTLIGDARNHLDTPAARSEHLAKVKQESTATKKDEAMQVEWANNEGDQVSWSEMVSSSVGRINAGELDKVVIARTAGATALRPIDTVACLSTLRSRYRACWTFHVDDFFGATPELLVAKRGDLVHSKVLAGTIHPSSTNGEVSTTDEAVALAATLLESGKDLAEHEYAVRSVASALAQHCDDLKVPKRPSVLSLHGISHLATEITGQLVDAAPLLTLAASLHPTAAVCGTPRERALALIRETERIDRGRYAGPVGWLDSAGDGELGIALRCAAITESKGADTSVDVELTAYAGCGLVSESCSEDEWQESEAKLQAIKGLFAV